MTYIIFGSDHFNTLGVLRCLGEHGIKPFIILLEDVHPGYLVQSSKYPKTLCRVKSIEEGYKKLLSLIHSCSTKPVVLTGMDRIQAYLDRHSCELLDICHFFNSKVEGGVCRLMDKFNQLKLAGKAKLNPIHSALVDNGELNHGLNYPILTKAVNSEQIGWKNSMHICRDEEELKSAYLKIHNDKVLLNEYIDKSDELEIMGISFNDGNDVIMPLETRYLRSTPGAYGTYCSLQPLMDKQLISKIKEFFKQTGFNGIFEIEFIIDKQNVLWFMEVNFRISAWVQSYADCGFNLPVIFGTSCEKGEIDHTLVHLKNTPHTALLEPTDFFQHVLPGHVGIFQWIKEFLNADTCYYYDRRDKKPFWKMVSKNIMKRIPGL